MVTYCYGLRGFKEHTKSEYSERENAGAEGIECLRGMKKIRQTAGGRKGMVSDILRRKRSGLNFGRRKKKVNMGIVKEVAGWIFEIVVTILIAFTCVYFAGLRTSVVGQSMEGTLSSGDEILVNRFLYKVTDPKPNDLVVFLPNGNEKSHYYVKRVIAVPGDTVLIQNGAVYVNGELFQEEVEVASIEEAGLAAEEITLGDDEYFVLGDNRNNSEDSRYANIGNVKKEYMIGKAWFRIAPLGKFGFL